MTEEAKTVIAKPAKLASAKHDVNDVDASWNGEGSLDDHRAKAFKEVVQPGFGAAGKVKTNGE